MAASRSDQQAPAMSALPNESNRIRVHAILERPDGGAGLIGQTVTFGGWIHSAVTSGNDYGSPPPKPHGFLETLQRIFSCCRLSAYEEWQRRVREPPKEPRPPFTWIVRLNDGSLSYIRILVDSTSVPLDSMFPGACILVEGILQKPPSLMDDEAFELKADKIKIIEQLYANRYRGD